MLQLTAAARRPPAVVSGAWGALSAHGASLAGARDLADLWQLVHPDQLQAMLAHEEHVQHGGRSAPGRHARRLLVSRPAISAQFTLRHHLQGPDPCDLDDNTPDPTMVLDRELCVRGTDGMLKERRAVLPGAHERRRAS